MDAYIKGTGSFLPEKIIKNNAFLNHNFYDGLGKKSEKPVAEVVAKLEAITGIRERRYIPDNENSIPARQKRVLSGDGQALGNRKGVWLANSR